ncbi:MAG: TPM domain-containing protein, partial [Muribaculaceae bacterium]|nr:TPM domain-containing protein [Muribaculaceae bacterium]
AAMARDYTPSEIPNPNLTDRRVYVADPGNSVSASTKAEVNKILSDLRSSTSAEVAVAVVPSIGDMTIEDFGEKLFTQWGLGKSDKYNGVLILIALDQRRARIQTGYGVEGVLPDISAKKIIDRSIISNMREGDLDAAVLASVNDVANVISDPVAAEELKSSQRDAWETAQGGVTGEDIRTFVTWLVWILFLFSVGMLIYDILATRNKDRYRKALMWHNHRTAYWILAACSLGLGLIPAAIAEWMRHRARNKPMKCPTCGSKMRKLNEEEDNALLTPSQDFEERLNTVDYDVWVCPDCGTVERYPFRTKQMKYSECPNCHTVAMCEVRDHTLVPATVHSQGTGEKIYECQFCHHQNRRRYVIPKKPDPAAAAVAAGAILGSSGRRGGGFEGGGGFGGGFGGGSTGGGGASGGW